MSLQSIPFERAEEVSSLEQLSRLLKACGDPLRLQVLQALQRNSYGVLELTEMLGTTQSGMSHHLKVLAKNSLVESHKQGNVIFYRRPNYTSGTDQHCLFQMIDSQPMPNALLAAISSAQAQRSKLSQQFFERHSQDLDQQQELICQYSHYAPTSLASLTHDRNVEHEHVLEIGPGSGLFLKELSRTFLKVTALDNAPSLLEEASRYCSTEQLTNVELLLGEAGLLIEQKRTFDAIVMNMVLHHVPSPAELVSQCGKLLKSDGVLTLCDLSSHDQTWARESCGDLWLGFEHRQLMSWAEEANLREIDRTFVGLRNGFQIQILTYQKETTH